MLNELLAIATAMDEAGIAYGDGHANIKRLGRGTAWRVRLGIDGTTSGTDLISADLFSRLWTLRDGQHNSFPFVKLPPLFVVDEAAPPPSDKSVKPGEQVQWLSGFAGKDVSSEWMANCFAKSVMASNVVRRRRLSGTTANAVAVLIDRFATAAKDPRSFGLAVAEAMLEEVDNSGSKDAIDAAIAAFSSHSNYYFDLPIGVGQFDVGDPRTEALVSQALSGSGEGAKGICVLTGVQAVVHDGPFPQPKLPVLGQTYLFSRNTDIPAAARYHRSAAASFPVGQATIAKLSGALSEITRIEAKGRTWERLPGEKPKQFDLLLTYVNAVGLFPVAAALTSGSDVRDGQRDAASVQNDALRNPATAAAFDQRASDLINAFKSNGNIQLDRTRVGFCIVRAVDPANRKVIYHKNIVVRDLQNALEEWEVGGKNLPQNLRLSVPAKKGDGRAWLMPHTIAPLDELVDLSRTAFVNGGQRSVKVVGLPESDALALFLLRNQSQAKRFLDLLLTRGQPLLEGIKHTERCRPTDLNNFDSWAALRHASALAILLHILGRKKDDYMEDLAYKLGQFLNAVDIIHVGYCLEERNGQVPPTLLGNSFFRMAQANPGEALGALAQRWAPYDRWMNKTSAETRNALPLEDSKAEKDRKLTPEQRQLRSAYYTKSRVRALCAELHDALRARSKPPDATFRAELLLGYLAGLPPRARDKSSDETLNPNGGDK